MASDYQVSYSREAAEDLDSIRNYILENFYFERIADKSIEEILDGIDNLGRCPNLGMDFDKRIRRRLDSEFTTRMLPQGKNLIFFFVNDAAQEVYILRVIPARRDYMRFLAEIQDAGKGYKEGLE